jgi:RteC protein.
METHYSVIIQDLDNDLSRMKDVSENVPEQLEYAIGLCKVALDRMRKLVIQEGFPDFKSEIHFFKKIKPSAYSKLLYYQAVFDIESKRKKADIPVIRRYLRQRLSKIHEYLEEHQSKVQYYRCGCNHLDEKYFIRNNDEIPLKLRNDHQLIDEDFFTWHDHTFSTIMAYEMLTDYIIAELKKLDNLEKGIVEFPESTLFWTGKKIELVEILYAVYFSGAINNGKVTIKEMAEVFGRLFNIDLSKDIYRYFAEIQQRKKEENQTKFLDFLRAILIKKLGDKNE